MWVHCEVWLRRLAGLTFGEDPDELLFRFKTLGKALAAVPVKSVFHAGFRCCVLLIASEPRASTAPPGWRKVEVPSLVILSGVLASSASVLKIIRLMSSRVRSRLCAGRKIFL